jgi:seryl-tRNA synthetase
MPRNKKGNPQKNNNPTEKEIKQRKSNKENKQKEKKDKSSSINGKENNNTSKENKNGTKVQKTKNKRQNSVKEEIKGGLKELAEEQKIFNKNRKSMVSFNRRKKFENSARISGTVNIRNRLEIPKKAFSALVQDITATMFPTQGYKFSLRGIAALHVASED